MFATLLMLYRNYEKWVGLNTQGRLHQQPRKDPVNRANLHDLYSCDYFLWAYLRNKVFQTAHT
jgi:hypothetical protein